MSCLLAFLVPHAYAGPEPIGQWGASLALPEGWTREMLIPSAGPDQFHDTSGTFVVVKEIRGTWLDPADAARHLRLASLPLQKNGRPLSEPMIREKDGVLHAEQQWTLDLDQDLAYELHVVGEGGLGYLVLAWSALERRSALRRFGRRIGANLDLPGDGSPWEAEIEVRTEVSEVAPWTVRYGWSPGLLESVSADARGDAFSALKTPDELIYVYLLLEESALDLEGMLGASLSTLASGLGELGPVQRRDEQVAGFPARVGTFPGKGGEADVSGVVVVTQLKPGVYLELRFLTYGPLDSRLPVFQGILETISVAEAPPIDAFPTAAAPAPSPEPLSPQMSAVLGPARLIGTPPASQFEVRIADTLYLTAGGSLTAMSLADGSLRTLPVDDVAGLPARRPDGLYVPSKKGPVRRVAGDSPEDLGFDAELLADAGADGLLVVRAPPRVDAPGFARLPSPAGRQVLLRAPNGAERVVASLGSAEVSELAVRRGEALLAVDVDHAWGPSDLQLLDLAAGTARSLGIWGVIGAISATPRGWLVTGTPEGGTSGVYAVSPTGEPALLLSGVHSGAFLLDGGDLLLLTRWRTPAAGAGYEPVAYQVPASVVAADGARFEPMTTSDVQAVAVSALNAVGATDDPAKVLGDPASIEAFLVAARRASGSRTGVALPGDPVSVDRLLDNATGDRALGQEGFVLLTALLCEALLAQGAEWAPGAPPAGVVPFGWGADAENHHAVGYLPQELVRSTLLDSEGWWHPAQSIAENVAGRRLVIGVDADAVQARVAAAERPGIDAIEAQSVADVVAWLQVEPANLALREVVYRRLAAAGRALDLVEVSRPFLGSEVAWTDLHASLSGRVAALDGASAPGLVEDLRAAIGAHPREASLYQLLGRAYEALGDAESLRRAVACYRKIVDDHGWSPFADDAKAALARLGG